MKKVFLALGLIISYSFCFAQGSTSCTCSSSGIEGCQAFCKSNNHYYKSMTCTASGSEGSCNCYGNLSHSVTPGSQCASPNT